MAEPMPDPGPEAEPTDPWPFLTDEDHAWLEQLLDYADELATVAEVPITKVVGDLAESVLEHDGHGWPDLAPEPARRWTVTDDGSAEWAMAKLAAADEALGELGAQAAEWAREAEERLVRIRAWFDHRARRHLATKAFMEAHLVRYALDRRDADPKHNKTLVLPSGAVKTTEQQPKVAVADERAVIDWTFTALNAEQQDEVAPPQPRKLYVQKLRDHTSVVEVIDRAVLLLANTADQVLWERVGADLPPWAWTGTTGSGEVCPRQADGWPSPEQAEDIVAAVTVVASHLEVHGPDGRPVPGTQVEPGGITAKVVPA